MNRPYQAFEEFSKSIKDNHSYPPKDGNYSKMYKEIRELIVKQYDNESELEDYVLYLEILKGCEKETKLVDSISSISSGLIVGIWILCLSPPFSKFLSDTTYLLITTFIVVLAFSAINYFYTNRVTKRKNFVRLLHSLASQSLKEMKKDSQ